MEQKIGDVQYIIEKSDSCSEDHFEDFLHVKSEVFQQTLDVNLAKRQFFKNIYGSSILVLAYIDNKAAGTSVLWRNDLVGHIAYQGVDATVLKEYRGKGIYRQMVNLAIEHVEKEAVVYRFPNDNSYFPLIKSGFILRKEYRPCLFRGVEKYRKEHPLFIDLQYAKYWFEGRDNYYFIKIKGAFFLVSKKSSVGIYSIVGEIGEETSRLFEKVKIPMVLLYKSERITWYNRSRVPTRVLCNDNVSEIPIWKMDVI